MRVLFLEDVPGTADAGEVKEVKNGFARNYLIPRQLAVQATPGQLQRLNAINRQAQEKRLKLSGDARLVAQALEGQTVVIEMRVGPTGRLFGAVTTRRIAEELNRLTERGLDHRNVLLGSPIHEPGDYPVSIRLYREVTSQVNVRVVREGYQQEEEAASGQAEADATAAEQADETSTGLDGEPTAQDESEPIDPDASEQQS